MPKYIALIRGINVGGHHKIIMADLKKSFEKLGFKEVTTYIQSGNVIFTSKKTKISLIEKQLENFILNDFGHQVPVIVIKKEIFNQVYNNNPFLDKVENDVKKIYVLFLNKLPDDELFKEIMKGTYTEEMVLKNQVIYIYYADGARLSKLGNNFFERKLKVVSTSRNWNTVKKISKKLMF